MSTSSFSTCGVGLKRLQGLWAAHADEPAPDGVISAAAAPLFWGGVARTAVQHLHAMGVLHVDAHTERTWTTGIAQLVADEASEKTGVKYNPAGPVSWTMLKQSCMFEALAEPHAHEFPTITAAHTHQITILQAECAAARGETRDLRKQVTRLEKELAAFRDIVAKLHK